MKYIKHIAYVLFLLVLATHVRAQDSEEEIKVKANKLFEKEKYVDATAMFEHLLSLHPRDIDINFKYGTCLLYNSEKKKEALRYLNLAVTDANVDPRAFYFRGRALHLDYRFEEAKKEYGTYIKKTGNKPDKRYDVARAIQMCNNGKRLLTTFTDIIVADKQEIDDARFFDIYTDSRTIGGEILVTTEFQSKLDKKMGHIPIVHFPPAAQAIYYSSYGDDLSTGKDIYVRRRLPNGKWGDPQRVPGPINTDQDEDFPFMHASGNFLYFSSTGHNSMGGYDVFMSRFVNSRFETPENVDFAISSPNDDLFYVVDEEFQNAYFASSRQSEYGKLHVYKVKVARVPIQEVIVMGEFVSEVDPSLTDMTVTLKSHTNSEEVGTIKTNPKGKYSHVFPQGGKYEYEIDVKGDIYKLIVEFPFLDEFRPLKQKIIHTNEDGNETVRIVNLFDEDVEGAEAILAEVIRKKSELEVNIDQFDLDQLAEDNKRDEVLAELGLKGLSMVEVADRLEELEETTRQNASIADRINSNIQSEMLAKSERIIQLNGIQEELVQKAEATEDPELKYKLLSEAQQKEAEKQLLIRQVNGLETLASEVDQKLGEAGSVSPDKLGGIKTEFDQLVEEGKNNEALALLTENKTLITQASEASPEGVVDGYKKESVQIRKEIKDLKDKEETFENERIKLDQEVKHLERQYADAKKKDQEDIARKIESKKDELQMVEAQLEKLSAKRSEAEESLNVTDDQISSIENATITEEPTPVNQTEVEEALAEVKEIQNGPELNYEEQLLAIEEAHPEVNGGDPIVNETPGLAILDKQEEQEAKILNDPSLSDLEKEYRQIESNEALIDEANDRIEAINEELEGGSNPALEEEKQTLQAFKNELIEENQTHQSTAEALKASTPDAALSKEDVIAEIAPNYEETLSDIENNTSLTPQEQLTAKKQTQEAYVSTVSTELEKTEEALKENPENAEAQGRKTILETILSDANTALEETNQALEELQPELVEVNKEELAEEIAPGYESSIASIRSDDGLTEEEQLQAVLSEQHVYEAALEAEIAQVEEQLEENPSDAQIQARKEALEELLTEVQSEITGTEQAIANVTPTATPVTVASLKAELAPRFQEDLSEIQSNPSLTEQEKLVQTKALQEDYLNTLEDELTAVQEAIDNGGNNVAELEQRKDVLTSMVVEAEGAITSTDQQISATPTPPSVTREDLIAELIPDHASNIESIAQDQELTPSEREEAKVKVHEEALKDIQAEKKKAEKKLKRDPESETLKETVALLEALEEEQQDAIAEANQTIAALENANTTPSTSNITAASVSEELTPNYATDLAEIENADGTDYEKNLHKGSFQVGVLETLQEEKARIEQALAKDAGNEELNSRLQVVEKMITEKEEEIANIKSALIDNATEEDVQALLYNADPDYSVEIEEAESGQAHIEREEDLQDKLRDEISDREKTLARKYSIKAEVELAQYRKLLEESESRVATERNAVVEVGTPEAQTEFIEELRNELLPTGAAELTAAYTGRTQLEAQDATLSDYERALDERIQTLTEAQENNPSSTIEQELEWLEEEKTAVQDKRRKVRIALGELETNVADNANANRTVEEQKIAELTSSEGEIALQLQDESLPKDQRKLLEEELEELREERFTVENNVAQQEIESSRSAGSVMIGELETDGSDAEIASETRTHYETESAEIDNILEDAQGAKTEAERNYLLQQAEKRQNELNDDVAEVVREQKTQQIEEQEGISLLSTEDLQQKKRRFTVRIGELNRALDRVEEELAEAKRKEIPALEEEKASIAAELSLVKSRLEHVDDQLAKRVEEAPVVEAKAMEQELSFNEERIIAASEDYKAYQELAVEALKDENQIRNLEDELAKERASVQRLIAEDASEEKVKRGVVRIEELESEIDRLKVDLTQKRYAAQQALPSNQEEAMKMQNLVARGVQPIKTTALVAALVQLPSNGLAIDTTAERPNNGTREIPVGVENPKGLVYRVQVGAFARPLRPDVFKEFNPVSGEKIEGTNITRYMAGFFSSANDVVDARGQIRELGYSDAFIVAYCDGQRISFGEARRREAAGECVPRGTNEIMMDVAVKTAENLGIPVSNELQEVPELTYNQAPGAVEADPIETMKGLFFTVQIGVYNRPVNEDEIFNLPEIFTFRLPNGQIRYNTGRFDSAEECVARQDEARKSGVGGAFIVAYYNGERISIGNARRLLNSEGKSILQSEMDKRQPEVQPIETPTNVVRADTVRTDIVEVPVALEQWEHRVQVVSKKTFDKFPRDVLNRYNTEGSFYYDEDDKRVKSIIYKNADYLPRLWNFIDDVDTLYLPVGQLEDTKTEIIQVVFSDSIIPGDVMDYMLRLGYRRTFETTSNGVEMRIFGVNTEEIEEIINKLKALRLDPEIIIETEDELELQRD